MNAIAHGVLAGLKEAPREFIRPTVSLVKGGVQAWQKIVQTISGPHRTPHRNRPFPG